MHAWYPRLIVLSLAGLVLALPGSTAAEARPPNIVVLLADDLGWGDRERHGGPARTPAIDRLAAEGVELRRCYAHPVCSPTRAALLTGCLPRRFGIDRPLALRDPGLPAGLSTLPRTLAAAGYATSLVGKWHLGTASPPLASGFDHFYGFLGPEIDSFTHLDRRGGLDWQRDGTPVEEEGYAAILMADEAVRIIERSEADRACFAGDWKLVVSAAGESELFHLGTDPGETHDLRAAEPGVTAILRSRLAEVEAEFAAPSGRAPPPRPAVPEKAPEGGDR